MAALGVALGLRLYALNAFVTVDEHTWALRSLAFRRALLSGNFAATYRSQHPGVITMWLTTLASLHPAGRSWESTDLLFAARPLVALLTWLSLLAMCWMIFRIWGPRVTLVSAILIGLDPFYLAHSRLLHLDGVLTGFMALCLLSLMVYLAEGRWGYLLVSATCGGLATLNKSPAVFMFPFAMLLMLSYRRHRLRFNAGSLLGLITPLALWTATATVVGVLCWPAMWVQPVETLRQVARGALHYAQTPHEGLNFFMGRPRPDPGGWFYPVVLLFRLSPLALVGALASLAVLFRPEERGPLGVLYLYLLLFCTGMTLGAKKFDRYLLPVFPVADLIAAIGLAAGTSWVAQRWPLLRIRGSCTLQSMARGLPMVLIVGQLALILPSQPYYLSYYNPLVGGAPAAFRTTWVGWGEGLDRAAQYLNGLPHAGRLRVMSWYAESLGASFDGRVKGFDGKPDVTTDYLVLYANQVQRHPDAMARYCGPQGPEHTVVLGGVEYAWVCSTAHWLAPLVDYVRTNQQPGDILVGDDPCPSLAEALDMPDFCLPEDEERTALPLVERLKGAQRAWYVYLPDEPPGPIRRQLAVWAHRLDDKPTEWGRVALYGLPLHVGVDTRTTPTSVHWRSGVVLTGLEIDNTALDADQAVGVSLGWRVDQPLTLDLSLGVRLVDAQGHVWGTVDEWLLDEDRGPTSNWAVERDYATDHLIQPLEGTPPGRYTLVAGLTNSADQQPLEIDASDLPAVGTSVRLAEVQVVRPARPLLSGHMTMAQPISQQFQEGIWLVGAGLLPGSAQPGESLPIALLWQADQQPRQRYVVRLQLRDREDGLLSEWSGPPVPSFPTDEWQPGALIRGQHELRVPADAPAGQCQLWVWLEPEREGPGLPQPPANAWLHTVDLQARDRIFAAPVSVGYSEEYALGGQIRLLGYDVEGTKVEAGQSLRLTLYWRAEQQMDRSWKVFTHLLDGRSQIWGQWDSVPMGGTYPTLGWWVGEVVPDEYEIPIRSDAPPGHYRLEVGMYDPETGNRLAVVDAAGIPQQDDRILLGVPIEIVRMGMPK